MCDNPDHLDREDLAVIVRRAATEGKGGYPDGSLLRLALALEDAPWLDFGYGFDPKPYVSILTHADGKEHRYEEDFFQNGAMEFRPRDGYHQEKYLYDERTK